MDDIGVYFGMRQPKSGWKQGIVREVYNDGIIVEGTFHRGYRVGFSRRIDVNGTISVEMWNKTSLAGINFNSDFEELYRKDEHFDEANGLIIFDSIANISPTDFARNPRSIKSSIIDPDEEMEE
jgi:hypothetical protein